VLADAEPTGAIVWLGLGTFYSSVDVSVTTQRLCGHSWDGTSIKPAAAVNVGVTMIGGALEHLTVDGSATTGKTGVFLGPTLASDFSLRHVRIKDFDGTDAIGLRIGMTVGVEINDCFINGNYIGCKIEGNQAGSLPTTTKFRNTKFRESTKQGVLQLSGEGVHFDSCLFEANGGEGLKISPESGSPTGYARNGVLRDCWFEGNQTGTTANTGLLANYRYSLVVDGVGASGEVGISLDNVRISTTATATDHKAVLLDYVGRVTISKLECAPGYPDNIVVKNALSFVQFLDDTYSRAVRFIRNDDGGEVLYPIYAQLPANTAPLNHGKPTAFTPTASGAINCSISGVNGFTHVKNGREVLVQGIVDLTVTVSATLTYFNLTLPFDQDANSSPAVGSAFEQTEFCVGAVVDQSSGTDDVISVIFPAGSGITAGAATVHLSYRYIAAG
jgi:hypothetical protein